MAFEVYELAILLFIYFYRYIVKDILGHGTFGQVVKCWLPETKSYEAVKIIKNQPAYYVQALVEVQILTTVSLLLLSFYENIIWTRMTFPFFPPFSVKQKA